MKKDECCSVFITTLMIVIPIGAVVALLIEIFSINSIYKMLTDLGSFIAGLLGFGGVIWLIWNQNKETRKILDSNLATMKNEAFEVKRAKSLDNAYAIKEKFTTLNENDKNIDFYYWNKNSPGHYYFNDIKKNIFFIEDFLRGKNDLESYSLAAIKCFIQIYEDSCWLNEEKNANYDLGKFILLLGLIRSIEIDKIDFHYFHFDPYFRFGIEENPAIFSEGFNGYNSHIKVLHIIRYMIKIVIPDLISRIHDKKL